MPGLLCDCWCAELGAALRIDGGAIAPPNYSEFRPREAYTPPVFVSAPIYVGFKGGTLCSHNG